MKQLAVRLRLAGRARPAGVRVRRGASKARGFTLMELLVVMSIFSTLVLIASDIFVISSRTQRKIYGLERVQADARYTMEAIVREVRTGAIDYSYYAGTGGVELPETELAMLQSDLTPIRFGTSSSTSICGGATGTAAEANSIPCLTVTVAGVTTAITPKNVSVRNLLFYVSPNTDPSVLNVATGAYASNLQPRVTVTLVLESRGGATQEQSTVYLQTTATSRSYKR